MTLPVYIDMATVARLLGWYRKDAHANSTRRARRFLAREDALVQRGSRYFTTPTLLREKFPEVWDAAMVRSLDQLD